MRGLVRLAGCAAVLAAGGAPPAAAAAGQGAPAVPAVAVEPALLARFQERVKVYVQLHARAQEGLPELEAGASAVAIAAHQEVVGQKIAQLRAGARQGELFFPELAKTVRDVVRRELRRSASARETVRDTNPRSETPARRVPLRVNAEYTEGAAISSVPPNVLLRLPPLPEGVLEYSFVGDALVLRDMVANIVVDFVSGAVPS